MTRALYQILEELVRLMAPHEEMQSILLQAFSQSFVFPCCITTLGSSKSELQYYIVRIRFSQLYVKPQ
ncbi:hypothetical protein L596_026475 [Steinernema carpocapsae]|uniref:Uncharacterized protein n=1 Tax=Steinernema carpocapsae TaxID=34508 RepID=A0A4U5M1H8_STECR|nr:hypothetical protein L596_026475 [Steinernema carpocapsae]